MSTPLAVVGCEVDARGGLSVQLANTNTALINGIRRSVLCDVKCIAIGSISIKVNKTCFWDEYVAHRIGLLPLNGEWQEGATLELNVTNDTESRLTVYSTDMKDPLDRIGVIHKIPIIYLLPTESISLSAHVVVDRGRTHARFAPGLASFSMDEVGNGTLRVESFGNLSNESLFREAVSELAVTVRAAHAAASSFK